MQQVERWNRRLKAHWDVRGQETSDQRGLVSLIGGRLMTTCPQGRPHAESSLTRSTSGITCDNINVN